MCKPNGEAGIPAKCPRRGDCRGCPHFAFEDGEREDRRTAPGPRIWAGRQSADLVAKFAEGLGAAGLPE
ncbi:UNVERIFIED_ORG: hypothetical protein GGD51_001775 [Rhizobium esperanzae]|uniref:hypothetical protein n=1 Tax=Rhizobium phaseoli TaxID=396 RepID=UPI000569B145|nr:hypothetical protein [Rhizobium phaseoli]PWI53497.1 hypothetical protein B5K03_14000 [Rhizobium phaseoli]